MKIAVVGDLHLGLSVNGYDRTDDISDAFVSIVKTARDEGCTAMIQTGDLFDGSSPSPEVYARAFQLLGMARDCIGGMIYVIPGNHDIRHGRNRSDALSPIRSARLEWLISPILPSVYGLVEGLSLLLLPYESKSRRLWTSPEAYDGMIRNEISDHTNDRLVVVGHHDVVGAVLSSEMTMRGGGMPWPKGEGWSNRVSAAINGHIHRPQKVRYSGFDIECIGTPVPTDFSEAKEQKRWIILDTRELL